MKLEPAGTAQRISGIVSASSEKIYVIAIANGIQDISRPTIIRGHGSAQQGNARKIRFSSKQLTRIAQNSDAITNIAFGVLPIAGSGKVVGIEIDLQQAASETAVVRWQRTSAKPCWCSARDAITRTAGTEGIQSQAPVRFTGADAGDKRRRNIILRCGLLDHGLVFF